MIIWFRCHSGTSMSSLSRGPALNRAKFASHLANFFAHSAGVFFSGLPVGVGLARVPVETRERATAVPAVPSHGGPGRHTGTDSGSAATRVPLAVTTPASTSANVG